MPMGPGDKPRGRQRCVCVCKRAGARATGRVEAPTALSAAEMVALDVERGVRAGGEVLCDAVRLAQPGASRIAGFLAHVDANGGRAQANELTMRHVPMLPRPLVPEAIRRIMAGLRSEERLIVEWAVTTGIRRMEVAGLTVRHLKRSGRDRKSTRLNSSH